MLCVPIYCEDVAEDVPRMVHFFLEETFRVRIGTRSLERKQNDEDLVMS